MIRPDGSVETHAMPKTERDAWDIMNFRSRPSEDHVKAYIEKVHSMPKQGVASSFKFGRSYGFLRGILVASQIPFEAVTPQVWQRGFSLPKGKGTAKKNAHKARAQELFPSLRITHAIADALLIAEYGRRKETGLA